MKIVYSQTALMKFIVAHKEDTHAPSRDVVPPDDLVRKWIARRSVVAFA